MPANFPANPTTNQVYIYNGTSWVWTGERWQVQLGTVLIGATGPTGATGASANLLNITSNVIPASHETYDLGANAQRWRDLYLSGNSFYLGNTILRSTGNTLQLPAGSTIGGIPVADTGQVTQIASTASPKISNVKVADNTWTILDDTAIDTAGGYILINGAGYVSVPQVYINNIAATSVSFVNSTQLRVQVPAFAAGTYPLYVINSDGGTGILVPGISFSGFPNWASPAAGNVGLNYETDAITSVSLSASSNSAVTYVLASGSLPPGVTLTGSTISGTTQATATNTTYNFTIEARDAENQSTLRAFSITVNTDVVSWSTPANAAIISGYEYGSVTQSLAATSAAGKAITYSGSNLPGNIVVTGSTVAGNLGAATNSTTASNTAATLTATAATTNRTASRTLFFVANPDQVTWSLPTSGGVLTGYEFSNLSATLSAVSAAGRTVSYSGTGLPANITITGATVSGLLAAVGNTSSNLTATAATTNRANTIPVTIQTIPDVVTWSAPTSGQTITIQATDVVNQALAATSAAGKAITYSATNLPTGLSVVGAAVTGTPSGYTSSTTVSSNLTATAATTNRSSTISITWSINLAISFATDPFFANVSLLLNATANASVISDASSNNFQLTPVGDVRASTFSPYLGGNYSVLFNNATPDNLIVTTDAGTSLTGDFTIESWIYMTATAGAYNAGIFSRGPTSSSNGYFFGVRYDSTPINLLSFHIGYGGSYDISSSSAIPLNQWVHVAASRSGTALKLFINGQVTGTVTTSTVPTMSGSDVTVIGRSSYDTDSRRYFPGYISNLRVVKNAALYTANFTPSTTALTNSVSEGTVSLLACQSARFADNSGNNLSVTTYNTPRISQYNPFNLVNTGTQGSMYFDGTGDYVNVTNNTIFAFGTGDFTIEAWVYQTATPATTKSIFGTGSPGYAFYITSSNQLNFVFEGVIDHSSATAVPVGSWAHLVVCRAASTLRMYINSTQVFSVSSSTSISSINQPLIGNNITGYIADVRVLNRAIYPAAYPEAALTTANNTVLLLNNSVTNNATNNTFLDSSANNFAITRNGNATQGSFSPFSNGGWSNYFDGTGDWLVVSHSAGIALSSGATAADNFTVECWFYPAVGGIFQGIFTKRAAGEEWNFSLFNTNIFKFGSSVADYTSGLAVNIAAWNHLAVSWDGTTLRTYVNGIAGTTHTNFSLTAGTNTLAIGSSQSGSSVNPINGYISNARILKGSGAAIYSGSRIIIPTAPFTVTALTQLLTAQDNRFIDRSTNAATITRNGDVAVRAFAPFAPAVYSPATHGGSIYLDGSGDYLTVPAGAAFAPGTGDFTVDGWFYVTSSATADQMIWGQTVSGTNYFCVFADPSSSTVKFFGTASGGGTPISSTANLQLNAWNYFSVRRENGIVTVYLNGVAGTATSNTVDLNNTTYVPTIGRYTHTATNQYTGYIANLRFIKGYAIVPSGVPTALNTAVYGTQLLLNATNAAIWDASGRNNFETVGDAKVTAGIGRYTNGSMYFDGTGDYIQPIDSPLFDFGTGDFTIEAWAYPTVISSDHYIFSMTTATGDALHLSINIYQSNWRAGLFNNYMPVNGTVSASSALSTWSHVALVRDSNTLYFFVNGVSIGTPVSVSGVAINCNGTLRVGTYAISSINFTGYISDVRVSTSAIYKTTFSVPARSLTSIDRTQLLTLQNNQPHNNHSFQDSGPYNHLITRAGNASQGTFSPFSPGGWSYYFNGSSSLTPSSGSFLAFGTGNYTIEFWIFLTQNVGNNHALAINANNGLVIVIGDGKTSINSYNVGDVVATTTGLAVNVWNHVAIVRSGTGTNQTAIYVNGVRAALGTDATNWSVTTNPRIGGNTASQYMYGYLNNIRVVTSAVYTTNFTPSTSPLQAIAGTTFLSGQLNRFVDLGSTGATFTTTGTPSVSAWSPFAPTASYTPAVHGGSAYFDGTGDYLSVSDNAAFTLGTNSFTAEAWVYPTTSSVTRMIMGQYEDADNTGSFLLYLNSGNKLVCIIPALSITIIGATNVPANAWSHVVITRSGSSFAIFLNGSRDASPATNSGSLTDSTYAFTLGADRDGNNLLHTGYIASARLVNGTAVYDPTLTTLTNTLTGATGVPTAPLTAITNTALLLNFTADAIEDRSARGVLETLGDARHSRAVTKFANASSMYFDGSGDYLRIPYNPNLWFGSSDWTIELWYYPTSFSTYNVIWEFGYGSPDTIRSIVIYSSLNTGAIRIAQSPDGTTNYDVATGGTAALNTWSHLAFIRNGANITTYINGVSQGTITAYSLYNSTTRSFYIGAQGDLQAVTMFNGYIQDLRVTKGRARYQPAAPTANLSVTASTVLLVPGNTANTVIRDSSVNNFQLTPFGDSRASNFTPYGTGWSAYFDGSGDYIQTPTDAAFQMGTGDYTLECWAYLTATPPNTFAPLVDLRRVSPNFVAPCLEVSSSLKLQLRDGSTGTNPLVGTTTLAINTWYHLAITRQSGTTRCFVNGLLDGSVTNTTNFNSTVGFTAGVPGDSVGGAHTFIGYLSNVRVIKGTALYTTSFIPSVTPLTSVANTSLLTCHTNRFADGSTNNFTITRNGDTAIRAFNPFNITNTGTAGSMYFDGTGDYVIVPYSAATQLGSADFTIELWVYLTATPGAGAVIFNGYSSGTTLNWLLQSDTSTLKFYLGSTGSAWALSALTVGTIILNSWMHIAIVRSGNTVTPYLNGRSAAAGSFTGTVFANTSDLAIFTDNSGRGNYMVTGYAADVRLVKGTAVYTANFTPATSSLTAIANTQLLTLQYRQPHNNHGFQDSSSNQFLITRNGNASQGTFSPFSPSGWSIYLDGSTTVSPPGGLTSAFAGWGGRTRTWECWVYRTSATSYTLASAYAGVPANGRWYILIGSTNKLSFGWTTGTGSQSGVDSASTVPVGWAHLAVTVDSTNSSSTIVYLGIDGIVETFTNNNLSTQTSSYGWNAMFGSGDYLPAGLTGNFSGLRWSSNLRYTSNYTLPTREFVNDGNTLFLFGQQNRFVEQSSNNYSVTFGGTPRVVALGPFSTGSYNPVVHGGSAYFDGSDYLDIPIPNSSAFDIVGAFSLECWFYYTTSSPGNSAIIGKGGGSAGWGATNGNQWGLLTDSGSLYWMVNNGSGGNWSISTTTPASFAWHHVAISYNGTTTRVWLNGSSIGTNTSSYGLPTTRNMLRVGVLALTTPGYYHTGYISGLHFVQGRDLYNVNNTSITITTTPPTVITNTAFMLNFTDAAIQDLDSSNVLETVADAREVNFGPLMSNYSVYFDGTGDYLELATNTAFDLPGDYTIEFWMYLVELTTNANYYVATRGTYLSGSQDWYIALDQANKGISFIFGPSSSIVLYAGVIPVNTWTHVAFSRSGSTARSFLNGVLRSSITDTTNLTNTRSLRIGADSGATINNLFSGYLSNWRIIKGTALYTANFTPATTTLTSVANTSLLTCHANRFRDGSANNFAITRNGDAKVTDFSPFGAQTANPPSIYFDGTGDYCVAPIENTINYTISGHSWTFECWFYKLGTVIKCLATCGPANAGNINRGWSLSVDPANSIIYMGSSGADNAFTGVTIPINAWNHIAYDYNVSSTTMRVYLNGVLVGTKASPVLSNPTVASSDRLVIGATYAYGANFDGYISDLRWTRGQTLYSGFEPPTQPFATR